jgi:protein TonB
MIDRPTAYGKGFLRPDWREIGRWCIAGIVVVGMHASAAWAILNHQPEDAGTQIAAAVMIDMEPMPAPVVAEPVKEEPALEPEPIEPEAAEPEIVEQVAPEAQPEEVAKAEPEEVDPLVEQMEPVVELPNVEVPLPVIPKKKISPEKPKKIAKPKEVEKPVEKKVVRKVEKTVTTAKVTDDKPREPERRQAPRSAASAGQSEKWKSKVQGYLARRVNRARGAGKGTVVIRFAVTQEGTIVASSVVGSSGVPELDQSVLERLRNASPVPSAPDDITVSRQSFTVPFRIQ